MRRSYQRISADQEGASVAPCSLETLHRGQPLLKSTPLPTRLKSISPARRILNHPRKPASHPLPARWQPPEERPPRQPWTGRAWTGPGRRWSSQQEQRAWCLCARARVSRRHAGWLAGVAAPSRPCLEIRGSQSSAVYAPRSWLAGRVDEGVSRFSELQKHACTAASSLCVFLIVCLSAWSRSETRQRGGDAARRCRGRMCSSFSRMTWALVTFRHTPPGQLSPHPSSPSWRLRVCGSPTPTPTRCARRHATPSFRGTTSSAAGIRALRGTSSVGTRSFGRGNSHSQLPFATQATRRALSVSGALVTASRACRTTSPLLRRGRRLWIGSSEAGAVSPMGRADGDSTTLSPSQQGFRRRLLRGFATASYKWRRAILVAVGARLPTARQPESP